MSDPDRSGGTWTLLTVHGDRPFRHSAQEGLRIGPFLDLLAADEPEITPALEDD